MLYRSQFRGLKKNIARYFSDYGGWRVMLSSPFFLISLFISLASYKNWIEPKWVDQSLSLIPSLLGFSLGTYAILFSLLNNRLKNALRALKNPKGTPFLNEINATFLHFIFIQNVCLAWAFLFDGTWLIDAFNLVKHNNIDLLYVFYPMKYIGSFMGHLLLVYSFSLVLASALTVYRIAGLFDPTED